MTTRSPGAAQAGDREPGRGERGDELDGQQREQHGELDARGLRAARRRRG